MSRGAGEHAGGLAPRVGYVAANLVAWTAALVRPPRWSRQAAHSLAPAWKRLAFPGVIAAMAVAAAMLWLDGYVTVPANLPSWVIGIFDEISDFGRSGWILIPLGAFILALAAAISPVLDRASRAVLAAVVVRCGFVFVAVGVPGLAATILKRLIGRVRPSYQGPFAYEPFSWRSDYASLPSGHSTTAFAALVAIGMIFPRLRPVLWLYALLIALSRVVVTAHYPSDVIAGAAFGAFGAILVRDWFAARRLGFHVGPDGDVRVLAGPSRARLKRVARALFAR
jgi:undecaprenyl-diphosphatase